jgi:uncharacterized protein YjiK
MMRRIIGIVLVVAACTLSSACGPDDAEATEAAEVLKARADRFAAALARSDSDSAADKPLARWMLPNRLKEISGIVLTKDGRLLAHGDETAEITEIDYTRGVIVKQFLLGDKVVRDDFEGITAVGDRYFMMTSKGMLYEFGEGEAKSKVDFTIHDAHLGKECELEGVAYDAAINSLLMPCKVVNLPELKGQLVIYRWSLDSLANPRVSQLAVPLKDVIGTQGWEDFHSSDIAVDPKTGNYVLVAAQEKALIVITPKGALVSARTLDDMHNQVEGVAIRPDGVLIITDEVGKEKPAAITMYRWR